MQALPYGSDSRSVCLVWSNLETVATRKPRLVLARLARLAETVSVSVLILRNLSSRIQASPTVRLQKKTCSERSLAEQARLDSCVIHSRFFPFTLLLIHSFRPLIGCDFFQVMKNMCHAYVI